MKKPDCRYYYFDRDETDFSPCHRPLGRGVRRSGHCIHSSEKGRVTCGCYKPKLVKVAKLTKIQLEQLGKYQKMSNNELLEIIGSYVNKDKVGKGEQAGRDLGNAIIRFVHLFYQKDTSKRVLKSLVKVLVDRTKEFES